MRIVRKPAAEDDLIDIWCHVALDSPASADRLLDQIARRIERLADHPELGPLRPDIAPEVRTLNVGRYIVMYRIADESVEIVRVVHGARDVEALF